MPDNSKLPSLPCLRLHELVAPTLVTHSWVGSRANCSVPLVDSKDDKAGHLIELVRIQTVTRREARKATQGENPLVGKTATGLLDQILQS
jgi:hypothetical protein